MGELLQFISLMIVLILHISYIKIAEELIIIDKKYWRGIMLLLLGVIGSLLCIEAISNIYALHLIIILNFIVWKVIVTLKIE